MSKLIFAIATTFLLTAASADTPGCTLCRDDLKKTLEVCKSESAGAAQDVCREDAHRQAKACEEQQKAGGCNLDLLMDQKGKDAKAGKS